MSPYLESCCLRLSANVSYQHAADDLAYLTGINVSKSAQQRLVHRQDFNQPEVVESVEELSVDGGNIRVRTSLGEKSRWKGYKAVSLHERMAIAAEFGQTPVIIEWVNAQPLAKIVTCLGDGHDGVWNIIRELASESQRREVLDWFHLMENLHKVGGSIKRLNQAEALLWVGEVTEAKSLFEPLRAKQAHNFCEYLERHRHRIINYQYYQAEDICSIGSGTIESTIKQIDRRTKISGAQWKEENVPQVLAQRCAYLNRLISTQ
jgi:hypothetical protein